MTALGHRVPGSMDSRIDDVRTVSSYSDRMNTDVHLRHGDKVVRTPAVERPALHSVTFDAEISDV